MYLNEYKYNIDGTIKEKQSKKYDGETWQSIRDFIKSMHNSIIDNCTIIPLEAESYSQAYNEVIEIMKEKDIDFS